jgi:hypothetical protein
MQYCAVLHIAVLADGDLLTVTTQDGTEPDTGTCFQGDRSHDSGGGGYKGVTVDIGLTVFEIGNHGYGFLY